MKLAFYKGKGNFFDKLIRWWTKSKYSHVELVIGGSWYSSSPREGEVRSKLILADPESWDFVEVNGKYSGKPYSDANVVKFFCKTRGSKYDWLGIFLSQIFPLGIHNKNRWFCSEWCGEALGLDHTNRLSPQELYIRFTKQERDYVA